MSFARHLVQIALFAVLPWAAQADQPHVYAPGGIAISGYDVVIYFTENRAAQGSAEYALMWRGATWFFVSPETMEEFEMNPTAYAPQYGGYCAAAVAEGQLAPSSPEAFTILDGKLYLNNSMAIRDRWMSRAHDQIESADRNWPTVLGR
jgi:YHS domain-containing protein